MASGDVFLHREHFSVELAGKIASASSFKAALVRGLLGNWLLCMAVWQAAAAQDVTGKLLGVMFPVSAYVTMVSWCHVLHTMCACSFTVVITV
jgi:formate/nitrite transporter FocA (FNT family)